MDLVRCQDQKRETLEGFYSEIGGHEGSVDQRIGAAMLDLLNCLKALPDRRRVFGLTSHYRLCLLATDAYESPWFVIVSALDHQNYFIEYLMPEKLAPWSGAYVKGEARSEKEAVEMILTAMERSEGWCD